MVQNTRDPQVIFVVVVAVGCLSTDFLEQGKWNSRISSHFWWNYLKPLREGVFFYCFVLFFNSSLLQFTSSTGSRHAKTKITSVALLINFFATDLKSIFLPHYEITSHTQSRNGNSSGCHESDLEATVAESRCCFPWVEAADLKPPKGRESEEECWRN